MFLILFCLSFGRIIRNEKNVQKLSLGCDKICQIILTQKPDSGVEMCPRAREPQGILSGEIDAARAEIQHLKHGQFRSSKGYNSVKRARVTLKNFLRFSGCTGLLLRPVPSFCVKVTFAT